jgi:hypothetical protein
MATSRDKLIADWRKRLATASEAPEEPTSRAAWLTRLRIRLYRFLLSLYGKGDWNGLSESVELFRGGYSDPASAPTSVLPPDLNGKPAKDVASIRAVLDSVADAQERPVGLGPLKDGLDAYDWVAVASSSGHVRTDRFLQLLRKAGFTARIALRGDDRFVEVYSIDYEAALALLASRRDEVRGRACIGQFEGIHFVVGITIVAIFSPFLILAIFVGLSLNADPSIAAPLDSGRLLILFFAGWGACIFAYCALAALRAGWLVFPRWKQDFLRRALGVRNTREH